MWITQHSAQGHYLLSICILNVLKLFIMVPLNCLYVSMYCTHVCTYMVSFLEGTIKKVWDFNETLYKDRALRKCSCKPILLISILGLAITIFDFLSAMYLRRTSKDLNFYFLNLWDKILTKIKISTNKSIPTTSK